MKHGWKRAIALGAASGIMVASSNVRADVIEREPVTPWHVQWEKDSCVVQRGFGDKEDMSVLNIEQFGPGPVFQLLLVDSRLRNATEQNELTITYGTLPSQIISHPIFGRNKERTVTLFVAATSLHAGRTDRLGPTQVTAEMQRGVDHILFGWANDRGLDLKTGPLDKVFAAMGQCNNDLLRVWGLDKDEQMALREWPRPLNSPSDWLRPNDYPFIPLLDGQQAIVNFVLKVGADGMPTDCKIPRSYGDEAFDKRTCSLLVERARFDPATNAAGVPVASIFYNTVRWVVGH